MKHVERSLTVSQDTICVKMSPIDTLKELVDVIHTDILARKDGPVKNPVQNLVRNLVNIILWSILYYACI